MHPALAQRVIAFAAVALLAIVLAVAVAARRDDGRAGPAIPEAVPAPDGGWYRARAAASGSDLDPGTTSACGYQITGGTMGVAHAVLPCGVKLYIGHGDDEVLTQVIGRGPESPNLQFGLTDALARVLGVERTATVRWRYARS